MGELQKKEEEMRQMFVQRVKEKEAELKEAEKEVCGQRRTTCTCICTIALESNPVLDHTCITTPFSVPVLIDTSSVSSITTM